MDKILHGDCLELMKDIPNGSIDMILCDLPYGVTACKWDTIIPFDKLWEQYERVVKKNGAILLFGQEPFSSLLRLSNSFIYRYDWIWDKVSTTNFANANKMPLSCNECISVFYKSLPTYNPIMAEAKKDRIRPIGKARYNNSETNKQGSGIIKSSKNYDNTKRFPRKIIEIPCRLGECNQLNRVHPTQKPVALFEYLIKTYTNEGELVLDNTAGSGTTAIACLNTNRQFIVMEKEQKYYDIIKQRVKDWHDKQGLFNTNING